MVSHIIEEYEGKLTKLREKKDEILHVIEFFKTAKANMEKTKQDLKGETKALNEIMKEERGKRKFKEYRELTKQKLDNHRSKMAREFWQAQTDLRRVQEKYALIFEEYQVEEPKYEPFSYFTNENLDFLIKQFDFDQTEVEVNVVHKLKFQLLIDVESEILKLDSEYKEKREDEEAKLEVLNKEKATLESALEEKVVFAEKLQAALDREKMNLQGEKEARKIEQEKLEQKNAALAEKLQAALNDEKANSQELAEKLQDLDSEKATLEATLQGDKEALKNLIEKEKLEQDNAVLTQMVEDLNNEKATLESTLRDKVVLAQKVEAEKANLQADNDILTGEVEAMNNEKANLQADNDVLTEKVQALNNEKAKFQEQKKDCNKKIKALKSEKKNLELKLQASKHVSPHKVEALNYEKEKLQEEQNAAASSAFEIQNVMMMTIALLVMAQF